MSIPSILGPAAVLILWSLIVMMWMVVTRFSAFGKADRSLAEAPRGTRYIDVEPEMPEKVNWVSHNFTHLMEQPTLFYAVVAVLAIAGDASALSIGAAWGYTILRVLHSLWQGLVNVVLVRTVLFTLSTLCLLVLAINAVRVTVI